MTYSRKVRATALSTLTIVAMGLPLACAAAGPESYDKTKVTVSYDDLDIASRDGATVLYSRLKRASRQACDYRTTQRIMSVREIAEARQCYRDSLEAAVRGIDSDALTRVHKG